MKKSPSLAIMIMQKALGKKKEDPEKKADTEAEAEEDAGDKEDLVFAENAIQAIKNDDAEGFLEAICGLIESKYPEI